MIESRLARLARGLIKEGFKVRFRGMRKDERIILGEVPRAGFYTKAGVWVAVVTCIVGTITALIAGFGVRYTRENTVIAKEIRELSYSSDPPELIVHFKKVIETVLGDRVKEEIALREFINNTKSIESIAIKQNTTSHAICLLEHKGGKWFLFSKKGDKETSSASKPSNWDFLKQLLTVQNHYLYAGLAFKTPDIDIDQLDLCRRYEFKIWGLSSSDSFIDKRLVAIVNLENYLSRNDKSKWTKMRYGYWLSLPKKEIHSDGEIIKHIVIEEVEEDLSEIDMFSFDATCESPRNPLPDQSGSRE